MSMSFELALEIYIYVWLVYSVTLVKKAEISDITASFIAGLFWPISIPALILRAVLR